MSPVSESFFGFDGFERISSMSSTLSTKTRVDGKRVSTNEVRSRGSIPENLIEFYDSDPSGLDFRSVLESLGSMFPRRPDPEVIDMTVELFGLETYLNTGAPLGMEQLGYDSMKVVRGVSTVDDDINPEISVLIAIGLNGALSPQATNSSMRTDLIFWILREDLPAFRHTRLSKKLEFS